MPNSAQHPRHIWLEASIAGLVFLATATLLDRFAKGLPDLVRTLIAAAVGVLAAGAALAVRQRLRPATRSDSPDQPS
jgi:xanthine/uracil permease